jgi:hypothetical protein
MNISYQVKHYPRKRCWNVDVVFVQYIFGERVEVRQPHISVHYGEAGSLQVTADAARQTAVLIAQSIEEHIATNA